MIFLTGAAGFIGRHTTRALRDAGIPFRALLSRPNAEFSAAFPEVEMVVGDLLDPAVLDAGLDGAQSVLHLASKNIDHDGSGFERVNIEGTRTLLDRAKTAGIERVVYISSVGVYGHGAHYEADETTPVAPDTPFSRSKAAAESLLLEEHARGALETVILRHRFVHGEGDQAVVPRFVKAARNYPFWIGGGRARMSLVWAPDLARIARGFAVGEWAADAEAPIYHVTDGRATTYRELISTICEHLGRRPPWLSIPFLMLYAPVRLREKLLGIDPEVSSASITSIRLEMVAKDNHFSTRKLEALVGAWNPTPFAEGFAQDFPPDLGDGVGSTS